MISNKADLIRYLQADRMALGINNHFDYFIDPVYRYEVLLRKREYYHNTKGFMHAVLEKWYAWHHRSLGFRLGFSVPINVCDEGLRINHYGLLVINPRARIGKNFDVHQGVNIGQNKSDDEVPVIGDNVFVGPGSFLYGKITIGNNVAIAAGSVVFKSFDTPNITIGGVPARVINSTRGNPFMRLNSKSD